MHAIPLSTLSPFDWFLSIVALVSMLAAARKGIIRVLFSIAGIIAGILIASWNYLRLATTLHRWITSFPAAQIVAFLAILVGVVMVFSLAAGLLRKTVAAVGLGFLDRLLGAAFGLLRGLLVGVAVIMACLAFLPNSPWIRDSRLAPGFLAATHAVSFIVPQHFQQQMSEGAMHLLQRSPRVFAPANDSTQP